MNRVDVVLSLPEDLVEQAKSAGLLDDDQIAKMLTAELEQRRSRIEQLRRDIQTLRSVEPSLTQEEIDAEIAAYRHEKKRRDSHGA